MTKDELDELYHLLRRASNDNTAVEYNGQQSRIYGLARHLLAGGDYLALIQYSAWYGEKYLVGLVFAEMVNELIYPERIIDVGAGLGWLGRGLTSRYKIEHYVTVDKRPWGATTHMLDIENSEDRKYLKKEYPPDKGNVIVMADFLHCTDNPREIIGDFADYPMVILEYSGCNEEHFQSYQEQLRRYSALVPQLDDYPYMFSSVDFVCRSLPPYLLFIAKGRKKQKS